MQVRSPSSRFVLGLTVAACVGLGCGSSKPEPAHYPLPTFDRTGPWAHMTHDQKLEYMKSVVLPKEKEIFAAFDPVRYASVDCKTCHGAGADDGSYRMPNPALPKVPGGEAYYRELAARDPKLLRFMQSTVGPETAKLLGVQRFDMASHTGFSCYQCHTKS